MKKIILASGSPRRRELLKMAELKFDICIKSVDESIPQGVEPEKAAQMNAKKKAAAVKGCCDDALIIGADTIVVLENQILGKPRDKAEACEMLKALSGNTHRVITGVCLAVNGEYRTFYEETKVEFYELTDDEIRRYVSTGEPMDKAGGYGIQGKGCMLIKKIDGDYYNVVGLPVARLIREMRKYL